MKETAGWAWPSPFHSLANDISTAFIMTRSTPGELTLDALVVGAGYVHCPCIVQNLRNQY